MKNWLFLLLLLHSSLGVIAWLPAHKDLFSWQHEVQNSKLHGVSSKNSNGRRSIDKKRRNLNLQKIRGVNVGSLFIVEPWMAPDEWKKIGCDKYGAESECVKGIGQDAANKAFTSHWDSWISEADLKTMVSYGLNTIRIPIGYWMKEDLVDSSQPFAQGAFKYLERLCGWAAAMKMYVILDLHAAPAAQKAGAPFTGVIVDEAGFYDDSQYDRSYNFLSWMTNIIHNNTNFGTVGMLEVVNEPIPGNPSLVQKYYPGAEDAIRSAESQMKINPLDSLTIQYMDKDWGAGNPSMNLTRRNANYAFDNHHYIWSKSWVNSTRDAYINATCSDDSQDDNTPLVFGEWSLAVSDTANGQFSTKSMGAKEFYSKWWAAQVTTYEKHEGWVWWSWKTDLDDFRWDYQDAVNAGIIPKDPTKAYEMSPCRT